MDKISDMLIVLKNGGLAGKSLVELPFSRYRNSVAKSLLDYGYIKGYEKKKRKKADVLSIELAYTKEGKPKIKDVKRISKPSRRIYSSIKHFYPVKQGHGKLILSTPKGIMSGEDAKKEMVGGELLFEIW